MNCSSCATPLAPQATFCKTCGRLVEDPLVGTMISERYRIQSKIAVGGFGAIYRATQVTTNRRVAIKVMHRELSDDEQLVARFRREARDAVQPARRAHRHDVRARADHRRPAVHRDGAARGAQTCSSCSARRAACRGGACSRSRARCAARSPRRTRSASSTATSSRRTSSSRTPRRRRLREGPRLRHREDHAGERHRRRLGAHDHGPDRRHARVHGARAADRRHVRRPRRTSTRSASSRTR